MAALKHDITGRGMNQEDLVIFLENVVTLVNELKVDYTALLADVTAIRAEVVKLVTDMGTRISDHNTLKTKLNADEGVTDTNYAAATAITAGAPAALTATSIAATALAVTAS